MGTVNILVVDDDVEFRKAVEEGLATVANVVGTSTPVEALWTMERTPIDILLCDMMLATSTSGLDVLSTVKDLWPRVGRILVTGFGNLIGRDVAAHVTLSKPFDMRSLRDLMRLVPILASTDEDPQVEDQEPPSRGVAEASVNRRATGSQLTAAR